MNTKSLLTRIGVPVLSLGLLGGLGATLATSASAATLASRSDVSAYFYNPSGNALGGPQAMGPLGAASVQLSPSQYLAKVTEPMHNANLVGKTVTITGHLDQSGIQYKGFDPSIGYGPHARVYFVGAGGTSDQSPQGYEGQSWWANSGSPNAILDLTQSGDFTLTVTVSPDPAAWSDWNGKQASDNAALFNQAASHVRELGLSFGGGYFFENGVEGNGTLTNVSIQVG